MAEVDLDFDEEGILDRLSILVDKLHYTEKYSDRRRKRYRDLAQAQIKFLQDRSGW